MAFQKGQPRPPNAGRKPGSKNKKKVARVSEFLGEKDINPAEEVLKILNDPKAIIAPKDRATIWLDLLSYCQAKPKAIEELPEDSDDFDDFEDVSNAELLKLIKSPNGTA